MVFHVQLAHGSPTRQVRDFTNVKQLYESIAKAFGIPTTDVSALAIQPLFATKSDGRCGAPLLRGGGTLEVFAFEQPSRLTSPRQNPLVVWSPMCHRRGTYGRKPQFMVIPPVCAKANKLSCNSSPLRWHRLHQLPGYRTTAHRDVASMWRLLGRDVATAHPFGVGVQLAPFWCGRAAGSRTSVTLDSPLPLPPPPPWTAAADIPNMRTGRRPMASQHL